MNEKPKRDEDIDRLIKYETSRIGQMLISLFTNIQRT